MTNSAAGPCSVEFRVNGLLLSGVRYTLIVPPRRPRAASPEAGTATGLKLTRSYTPDQLGRDEVWARPSGTPAALRPEAGAGTILGMPVGGCSDARGRAGPCGAGEVTPVLWSIQLLASFHQGGVPDSRKPKAFVAWVG